MFVGVGGNVGQRRPHVLDIPLNAGQAQKSFVVDAHKQQKAANIGAGSKRSL